MSAEHTNYQYEISVPWDSFSAGAQKILDNAVDKALRDQVLLDDTHILSSIITVEWNWFYFIINSLGLGLNPDEIRDFVRDHEKYNQEKVSYSMWGNGKHVPPQTQDTLMMSLEISRTHRRPAVEVTDLFTSIFNQNDGIGVLVLAKFNIDNRDFRSKLLAFLLKPDSMSEQFKKHYDLPTNLKNFATNLNFLAVKNKLPPLFGREAEIMQVMEILCHRERPNSVLLIGEPGVGKTAIAEGLARKIEFEQEKIPVRLRKCQIVNLQMNAVIAQTKYRGDFEKRLQNIIRDIQENPHLILFIDEAHIIIGAGSVMGGANDAANILKAVLARGEVRIIAATTLGEYREFFKEDEAFDKRFRIVRVEETTTEETKKILYDLRPRLELNYSVKVSNEAIDFAIEVSPRYVRHLRLPDKVIGWLDTACVRAENAGKQEVGIEDIVGIISNIAQIPVDLVTRDISERLKFIEESLSRRVVGQKHAIEAVAKRLKLNKGPLKENFDRPDGVLLFLGPTGVGKTELAKALAEFLFEDEKRIIRIDMSEYGDWQTSVSKLIGAPKGFVDSGKGGVLTTQLRNYPYSVILLDEIEKAHVSVRNLFLQAFDEGWISDGRGKRVYFSDSIIIMTSNLGSEHFKKMTNPVGFRMKEDECATIKTEIKRELEKTFSPEFINRIDNVVIFNPLSHSEISEIAFKILKEIGSVMQKSHKTLRFNKQVLDVLVRVGYSLAYGARFLKRKIEELIKMPINAKWKEANLFTITVKNDEIVVESSMINETAVHPKDKEKVCA